MESNRIGFWLQAVANIGFLLGLILVGLQINQNTKIAQANLLSNAYSDVIQYYTAMLGENPATAFAKVANDPSSLTDEELLIFAFQISIWANLNERGEMLLAQGLGSHEQNVRSWQGQAHNIFGGNPISRSMWEDFGNADSDREWVRVVEEEIRNSSGTRQSDLLERLRSAAQQEPD